MRAVVVWMLFAAVIAVIWWNWVRMSAAIMLVHLR